MNKTLDIGCVLVVNWLSTNKGNAYPDCEGVVLSLAYDWLLGGTKV